MLHFCEKSPTGKGKDKFKLTNKRVNKEVKKEHGDSENQTSVEELETTNIPWLLPHIYCLSN